jgi:hypothetical protein
MNRFDTAHSWVTKGFLLAGAVNVLGVTLFSKFFTNSLLSSLDPGVFSRPGLAAIILWGLAYWSVARAYHAVPYLVFVFFVEKMLYTVTWLIWLARNGGTLGAIFAESPLTAAFYSIYGAIDFAFGVFFLWVAVKGFRMRETG